MAPTRTSRPDSGAAITKEREKCLHTGPGRTADTETTPRSGQNPDHCARRIFDDGSISPGGRFIQPYTTPLPEPTGGGSVDTGRQKTDRLAYQAVYGRVYTRLHPCRSCIPDREIRPLTGEWENKTIPEHSRWPGSAVENREGTRYRVSGTVQTGIMNGPAGRCGPPARPRHGCSPGFDRRGFPQWSWPG